MSGALRYAVRMRTPPRPGPRVRKERLAALALALALWQTAPAAARPLVYGLVPNAPPTTYVDAAGKPTGFFIELYSRIMDELENRGATHQLAC